MSLDRGQQNKANPVGIIQKAFLEFKLESEIVIWTNFNLQSVCTYQLLFSLIRKCSTCYKESIDYKIVEFGYIELIL